MLAGADTAQTYIGILLFVCFFYLVVLPVRRTYVNLGMRPAALQLFWVILNIFGVAILVVPIRREAIARLREAISL